MWTLTLKCRIVAEWTSYKRLNHPTPVQRENKALLLTQGPHRHRRLLASNALAMAVSTILIAASYDG